MSGYEGSGHPPLAPAGRGLTGTLVGMLAIVAVTWLLSLVVAGPLAYGLGVALTGDGRAALLLGTVCWTLSAGLLLLRGIEARFARLLFEVRRPGEAELERIGPVWRQACRRAGVDPANYTLRVEDSQRINAFALGAHFVAVTRRALELPDELLESVLAHELGHHRDLHPLAATLGWWYLMPLSLLSWLLRRVRTVTRALYRGFAGLKGRIGQVSGGRPLEGPLDLLGVLVILGALVAVGTVLLLLLCAVWLPLWLLTRLSRLLSAALSRAAEYAADRRATELGYGAGLIRVLELFALDEQRAPRRGNFASRLASHPTCQARIDAVRRVQARAAENIL
ncbi:MAG TPA: M48 family metalloprotease [Actinomycetes bacterium]|nr:M48 family metalloprotease [Actinomycetes bacterium]